MNQKKGNSAYGAKTSPIQLQYRVVNPHIEVLSSLESVGLSNISSVPSYLKSDSCNRRQNNWDFHIPTWDIDEAFVKDVSPDARNPIYSIFQCFYRFAATLNSSPNPVAGSIVRFNNVAAIRTQILNSTPVDTLLKQINALPTYVGRKRIWSLVNLPRGTIYSLSIYPMPEVQCSLTGYNIIAMLCI